MGWILRTSEDKVNPTLAGGVYGFFITAGRPVYWRYDAGLDRMYFIIFISDGGRYGLKECTELSYQGGVIPGGQYVFHPGTYTKQIAPKLVSSVDASGNVFTSNGHGFENDYLVRGSSRDGVVPGGVINNQKYYIINKTTNTFQISLTSGGAAVDLTDVGVGELRFWRANAGVDDPVQGYTTHFPEIDETFSGISYVEGYYSTDLPDEPNWQDFRIVGIGRKLMDYNNLGVELGVTDDNKLLMNPALICADVMVTEFNKPLSRIGWASWKQFRDAAAQKIWQKNEHTLISGLLGNYFQFSSTPGFENFIISRIDETIDFDFGMDSPIPGVAPNNFAVKWKGEIEFPYSQVFTIKADIDDGIRVKINNQYVINRWAAAPGYQLSGQISVTTGIKYPIEIEMYNAIAPAAIKLYWQSASQSSEIIPSDALSTPDIGIERYIINIAFASPTEAADVFDRVIDRCPGWNWTDKNGKIEFLAPTRPVVFEFLYDSIDTQAKASILEGGFEAKKRNRREKPNFSLYEVRDFHQTNFPTIYVEADRPELREFGNTSPDNNEPVQLGIMTKSQAERIAELEMVFKSDPENNYAIDADRMAGGICKAELVKITHYVHDNKKVVDGFGLVESFTRQGDKLNFNILPVPLRFYIDEVYVPPTATVPGGGGGGEGGGGDGGDGGGGGGDPVKPDTLAVAYLSGNNYADLTWVNHGALGNIIIQRDYNGGGFITVATLDSGDTSWTDYYIYTTGFYTYRVSNTAAAGYDEGSLYAYFGYGGGYGGGGCFSGDTRAYLNKHSYALLKDMFKNRDAFLNTKVMSFSTRHNLHTEGIIKDVYRVKSNEFCILRLTDGQKFKSTPKHRYWTSEKKYVSVSKLKKGDKIFDNDFNLVEVKSVKYKKVKNAQWFYNLTIEHWHNYFIGLATSNLKPPLEE